MSDTPITNAETEPNDPTGARNYYVNADFARQLERELNKTRADRDAWKAKAEALSPSRLTADEHDRLVAHYGFTHAQLEDAQAVRHKDGRLVSIVIATAEGATK